MASLAHIEYIAWHGPHKDLKLISGHHPESALLVDDHRDYVHPEQTSQWVRIEAFTSPYEPDDELERVWGVLCERFDVDVTW